MATADEKVRELEKVLHHQQNILDRLAGFEERLRLMSARLSGDRPIGVGEDSGHVDPAGIIGQLQTTHAATRIQCDAIAEWLDIIESTV